MDLDPMITVTHPALLRFFGFHGMARTEEMIRLGAYPVDERMTVSMPLSDWLACYWRRWWWADLGFVVLVCLLVIQW